MIVVENSEGKEELAVIDDSGQSDDGEFFDAQPIPTAQVSMHVLCGATSNATTFTLKLQVGNKTVIALVDSGSDISFISAKFATKAQLKISQLPPLKVVAANGERKYGY